ncbi:hypothetical protein [Planomonospora sp. ID82291]|uniref:hypothetical protein n=1 Tax=Planomonospora sp. ID82291 TaxID=2738136 RepID=UPI0018C37504|nr:hypothetical protein [Planomonospora sp. ID82291]MBG0818644.1 hypothetical protein [Planomonospora sp. ID82291]
MVARWDPLSLRDPTLVDHMGDVRARTDRLEVQSENRPFDLDAYSGESTFTVSTSSGLHFSHRAAIARSGSTISVLVRLGADAGGTVQARLAAVRVMSGSQVMTRGPIVAYSRGGTAPTGFVQDPNFPADSVTGLLTLTLPDEWAYGDIGGIQIEVSATGADGLVAVYGSWQR